MPKPTLTEMVQELQRSLASIEHQVSGIDDLDDETTRISRELTQLRIAVNQDVAELKVAFNRELAQVQAELATTREKAVANEKAVDLINQRRWTLVVAIVSALLGGFLTFVIQFSMRALPR